MMQHSIALEDVPAINGIQNMTFDLLDTSIGEM